MLIIAALICLGIINLAPWAYVKCNQDYKDGDIDKFIFKNYNKEDIGYDNDSQQIISIFEPNKCSNSSCNYIGLTFNDFSNTPKMTSSLNESI